MLKLQFLLGIQYIPVKVYGDGLIKAIPEVKNTFTLETHIRSGVKYEINSQGFRFEKENEGNNWRMKYIFRGEEGKYTFFRTR